MDSTTERTPTFPSQPAECRERGCWLRTYVAYGSGYDVEHNDDPPVSLSGKDVSGGYWPATLIAAFRTSHAEQDARNAALQARSGPPADESAPDASIPVSTPKARVRRRRKGATS